MSLEKEQTKEAVNIEQSNIQKRRRNTLIALGVEAILLIALVLGVTSIVFSTDVETSFISTYAPLINISMMLFATIYGFVLVRTGQLQKGFWRYAFIVLVAGFLFSLVNVISQIPRTGGAAEYASGLFGFILISAVAMNALEKRERNRALVISLVVSLVAFFMVFLRPVPAAGSGGSDLGFINLILGAAVLVSLFLTGLALPRGVRLFRRSTGFKLGVGFAVTSLITLGFMVFAISVLTRVSTDFDYTRYADNEQIYANALSADVRGMAVHLNEYLLNYKTEGLDEAYVNYMNEYETHYANTIGYFAQLDTLHQEGWGFYIPNETEADHSSKLVPVQNSLVTYDTLVDEMVVLVNQRGFKDSGLEGELRQAAHALEDSLAFQQFPELKVMLLQMRRHEKDWILRQEMEDVDTVNSYGSQAIALMKSLEIPTSQRLEAERNINTYLEKFSQVVALDQQITNKKTEIERAFEPINPMLKTYIEGAAAEVEAAQARLVATEGYVQNAAIAFGIGAFLVAGLVSFVTTRVVVRPITSLTATASELAEGNLDARSTVKSQDETGALAEVFNQMAERLQSTLAGLETTIAERTAELRERAQEMEASQRVTFAASERTSPADFLDLLVNLLVDQFDVYHAQVYLLDNERKNAVLSQSTGYAGRVLLQRKHFIPLERESLVTRCIKTGEPVLVADTHAVEGWLPNELLPHTQSELVVPLMVEDEVIGALDIQDRVANRFSESTVPVFQSMTEQVSFLYQNNELLEEIESSRAAQERFAKQLATAAFIANQLGAILDLDQLLNQAVTMLQSQFNLYHAHIYLLDEAQEKLVVQAGSGHVGVILTDRGHSIPVDREKSLVARSFRERVPVLIEDVTLAEGFLPNPLLPDTRSELAVPLVSRGQVIGVLDIQDENVGRFTEVDANTMNTLAVQMATAIENAQLFRQTAEERERFETLVNYAPDAILMLNYENFKFVDANRNAESMFGMTRKELLKIGPGEVSPVYQPDGRESGEKAAELILNAVTGADTQFEWVHVDKDGREFVCEIRLALLPGEDKVLLVNITDITDRKQAQNAIIEGDKLKSEFLANMSHELRTPLNSIVGYTDVLMMGVDGDLNDEMLMDVQAIQENSQLLLKIINDILDLAKIEAKRVIFELSEVEAKDVLENVARNNAGLLVNKPVEMKVDVRPNLPKMEVDAMRVEQVLNNLVSNAVKFTEKGHITLRAFTEKDWMVMQVEDTGMGIADDDLQVIFEEFRQADGSQTRTVEGTGLGLTITRRLVHMHNGTIEVESEYGKGSTFTVRLPLKARISPEVTVKKTEKKDKKQSKAAVEAPVDKETAASSSDGKANAPKADAAKKTGSLRKAQSKGNGKNGGSEADLIKAAELFAEELKEAVANSGPNSAASNGGGTEDAEIEKDQNKSESTKSEDKE